ncbi:hypothetical protein ACIQOW_31710 [Kitasatospora sp. NPDC091335]|uniref:hypothetical protein n=1 Tax=Kitasatospora sp. NPDC091335 TaxID=3364085 RepID=UPI003821AED5
MTVGTARGARVVGAVLTTALVAAGAAACEGGEGTGQGAGATAAASTPPQPAEDGGYELPAEGGNGGPDWFYEFTMAEGRVAGLALVRHNTYCA